MRAPNASKNVEKLDRNVLWVRMEAGTSTVKKKTTQQFGGFLKLNMQHNQYKIFIPEKMKHIATQKVVHDCVWHLFFSE